MGSLAYSEALYILLAKVDRGVVLFHDECEAHIPGFSWVSSDMSVPVQESMRDFRHAGLIEVGRHEPWGSAVSLSDTGAIRLTQWREQRDAGFRAAS